MVVDWCSTPIRRFAHLVHFSTIGITLTSASETLKTTTPLLTRVILTWLSESYVYYTLRNQGGEEAIAGLGVPQGVGYGIGLAFALFIMRGTSRDQSVHIHAQPC